MNKFVSEQEVTDRDVYNEVVSLLAHMDDQDKDKSALRIAFIAETKLAIVVTVLLEKLQQDEQNRVDIYCVLEKVLQQDTGDLERGLLNKTITLALNHMRETQEATNEVKVAASNTLVTLASCYFDHVMSELLCHLKPPKLPEEFIFVTLGNLSSAYALKCIPVVRITLNAMFSVLEFVNDSRMRQAFCGVLEKWSRAVKLFLTNWEKCSFPRVGKLRLCNHFFPIYSHVTSNWLTCEELELKQAIIKALGPMMSLLLHKEEYQDQIFEPISWLLEQYKEDAHVFHITKSLSQLLEVSGEYKIPLPKGKFQAICSALHNQICSQAKPLSTENHAELVHCIILLARSSPEDLIAFLHSQLTIKSEAVCVMSLNLLRAIVDADLPKTGDKKCLIVKAVKSTLGDQNATVRKAVLHFIRRLLSSESVENCAAWDMVAHVFMEFSVSTSKPVLWPRLLEYVVPAQYTGTLKPLCRCLRELAEKKQQEGEEAACLDYGGSVKLPTPQGLLARLLVVASSPYAGEGHGCAALQLLKALHQNIHAAVGEMWVVKIPSLLQYIEGNTENSLDHARWEHMLLQFLRTSLEMIDDSAWSRQISLELSQQMASYTSPSHEKSFLYKALGTSLAVCQDLVHVKSQLHKFLTRADYMEVPERQGVISILALSAESHLDLTLNVLQEFGAAMSKVKISGFISRLKDYHHGKRGKTRSTLMLTYSSVAVHAPKDQFLSRVEADITGNILLHYRASCQVLGITVANKDMDLKLTLIHNVMEISCALLETRDSQEFEFSYKLELLGYMLDFIKKEPLHSLASPVRYMAILAIGHLSKLKPSLTLEENRELLDQCFKSLFPLPPLEMMKKEGETAKDALLIQSLYVRSLEALGKLMETLLEEEPTADWFQEMFELLATWFSSGKEWERERTLQASTQLLTAYQETVHSTTQETFNQFGSLIGRIAPYSCDSLAMSRQWVVDCISCLLSMQGQPMNLGSAEEELNCLREELTTAPDPEALFQASSKMARVVSEYFPSKQATDFIEATMDSMLSASPTCATAAGLWLKIILQECGDAMLDEVPTILDIIYSHMSNIQEGSLRRFLLEAVSILAHHHLEAVISSLLSKRLPMDSDTTELWRSLGGDPLLATQVLQVLIEKIKTSTSQEGSVTSETETDRHLAAAEPLSATCAISEVVSALQSRKAVQELLPELFPVLLQQVSRTLGQKMPLPVISSQEPFRKDRQHTEGNPCRFSVQALESVLFKVGNAKLVRPLREQGTWILLENPQTHHEGVCLLVSVLLRSGLITPEIIQSLLPWVNSPTENYRVTGTAFFAQLMSDPMLREKKFLKSVLHILAERSQDRNSIVRQMAVRGLGNIVNGAPEKVKKHKKILLDILIGALHDIFSSEVIGESMKALAKVLKELKEKDIGSSFRDLTQQIRTYFDDEDDALRSMAFVLFGILAQLTKKKWKAYFTEQVRKSWVTLLLHLQDPNLEVSTVFVPVCLCTPGPCLPRTEERPQLCLVKQLSSV
ncbi:maestro heat-like repeat-containing protein family member 2B [Gopherus flavomarginatus]|uniref:maestro heat-like repeat-containing protein family member 2B n=1 Tax=Gopherus flavomarginatus TaxID=286002 RepID=UPI0021CBEBB7|nr:maestro heat-like repeat-containing protein family member 2B [Gopherus flavomarginatus]